MSETWLSPSVPDGAVALPGYSTVVRVDRSQCGASGDKKRGGGVLLLINDSVRWVLRSDLRVWPESVWIEIKLRSSSCPLIIGCVYRPPSSDAGVFAQALESTVNMLDFNRSRKLVVGDFNAKSPAWLPSDSYNSAGEILEPVFLQQGLHQHVSAATHLSAGSGLGSLLDLVLSSAPHIVSNVSTNPPLGSSDHLALLCQLDVRADCVIRGVGRRIWSYDKADFSELNKALNKAAWPDVFDEPNVDAAWDSWQSLFLAMVSKYVPSKVVKRINHKSPFVTATIEKAIKEKRMALRVLKKQPSAANREAFRCKRNLVTHLLRKSERAYATSLHRSTRLSPSPSTSQRFWQHMKTVQGKVKHTIIPDLSDPVSGTTVHDPLNKASLLNSFFCQQTVLSGADTSHPDVSSLPTNDRTFDTLRVTPKEVFDVLTHLKDGKALGLDGIPPKLRRLCANGISSSLASIFNYSFGTGQYPTAFKKALVIPIHKKGARDVAGNYRPIALLPIVSKVMERLVHNKVTLFLSPWFAPNQSGF